jgi:hypothetical protein
MNTHTYNSVKRQTGLSLVDVMVGMVLALIGTVIIFQAFEVSEKVKRVTTGSSDASQNAVQGVLALERAVKMAGYGLNASDIIATPPPVALTVSIAGAVTQPDSIAITYRPPTTADCFFSDTAAGIDCHWEYGTFSPQDNKTFALPTLKPMTVNYCLIQDAFQHSLLVSRRLPCNSPAGDQDDIVLVDNLAQFKAVPIMDSTGTRILSLQFAVVARNAQPEKPRAGQAACDYTTGPLPWSGGQVDVSGMIGLAPGDDWKCYHYRVFSATVPLRNVLWH